MTILLYSPLAGTCQEADKPSLSLQIQPVKSTLLVGEPLLIECLFTNVSDEPVSFLPWMCGAYDFFGFIIKKPDGNMYRFQPGAHGELASHACFTPVVLSPGESCRHLVPLVIGLLLDPATGVPDKIVEGRFLDFVLRETGNYEITATFSNSIEFTRASMWRGDISSNTISVEVKQPTSTADVAALDIWGSGNSRAFFVKPGGLSAHPDTAETWSKLISDYPESVYAMFANYYLAELHMFRGGSPRYDDAIAQFQVAIDLLPKDHPLSALAEHHMGICLLATGKTTEGVQVLESFLEKQEITSAWTVGARNLVASPSKARSDDFYRWNTLVSHSCD